MKSDTIQFGSFAVALQVVHVNGNDKQNAIDRSNK
jgi:hypothetical protein